MLQCWCHLECHTVCWHAQPAGCNLRLDIHKVRLRGCDTQCRVSVSAGIPPHCVQAGMVQATGGHYFQVDAVNKHTGKQQRCIMHCMMHRCRSQCCRTPALAECMLRERSCSPLLVQEVVLTLHQSMHMRTGMHQACTNRSPVGILHAGVFHHAGPAAVDCQHRCRASCRLQEADQVQESANNNMIAQSYN